MEFQDIQKLIQTFDSTGLNRMNYTNGTVSITLEKGMSVGAEMILPTTAQNSPKENVIIQNHTQEQSHGASMHHMESPVVKHVISEDVIKAPMVGVFYPAASPEMDPYVGIGQKVQKGQVLCILEAMKVMNEIQAEWDGFVESILVEPEQIVEFGQPLFQIRRG